MDRPLDPESAERAERAERADDSDDTTSTVREDVTRAIDPEDVDTIRGERDATDEAGSARFQGARDVENEPELAKPPDLPESVEVSNLAPDGTAIGDRTLTSPTGEAIGGSGLSDAIQGRAGALGGDALGRGIDFDPSTPGTNESGPGGSGGGDPDMDRMLMGRDGSLISQAKGEPRQKREPGQEQKLQNFDDLPAGGTKPTKEEPGVLDKLGDAWDWLTNKEKAPEPPKEKDVYTENPEGDAVDSVTNLERVTVMQGSQVQPSNNPDDPASGGVSTDNWIPPADLETMPTQEGDVEATTLTPAASLGSSPVVNPTDPVLGDDGVIHGGQPYGGGSSGGGEVTPTSITANASALGGEGEANLPITLEPAPPSGGASALASGADAVAGKQDVNGVSIDMVTGQVVGSAAPAAAGELTRSGGMVGHEDEGGGEGDDDPGVQSFGAGGVTAMGGPSATAFGAAAPMVSGGMVSQGDEDDGDDPGVQSFGGDEISSRGGEINAPDDPAMALGSPDAGFGGADLGPGAPPGLEGGPQSPDDGSLGGPPSDHDG